MHEAVDDVRRLLAAFREANVGNDGNHAASKTPGPSMNDVDAPAAAPLGSDSKCRPGLLDGPATLPAVHDIQL